VALFDGLKLNNTVMKLNVSSNNLGEDSARALSELIWIKKPTLLYLDVTNNPFKKGSEQFEGIERNEFVLEFDVRGCELGKPSEEKIEKWIKRNEKIYNSANGISTTTITNNTNEKNATNNINEKNVTNNANEKNATTHGRPATANVNSEIPKV